MFKRVWQEYTETSMEKKSKVQNVPQMMFLLEVRSSISNQ